MRAATAVLAVEGHRHALAGREAVRLHHRPPAQLVDERGRGRDLGERLRHARWGCRRAPSASFAHAFEPSMRAPSAPGPERRDAPLAQRRRRGPPPAAPRDRPPPGRRRSRRGERTRCPPGRRPPRRGTWRAAADPGVPGRGDAGASTSGLRDSPQASACSRPPPPTTRTLIAPPGGSARARARRSRRPRARRPAPRSGARRPAPASGSVLEGLDVVDLLVPALELLVDRRGVVEHATGAAGMSSNVWP